MVKIELSEDDIKDILAKLDDVKHRALYKMEFIPKKKKLIVCSGHDEFVRYCQNNGLSRSNARHIRSYEHLAGYTPDTSELIVLSYPAFIGGLNLSLLRERIDIFRSLQKQIDENED